MNRRGFTLLEVLIASAIFAFSIIVLVQSRSASLRNAYDSQDMFKALQLAQSKMVEMELKYQSRLDKDGGVKDKLNEVENGTFEAPNDQFKWDVKYSEASIKLGADSVRKLLSSYGMDKEDIEAQIEQQKLLLGNVNKVIRENLAELAVTISWERYGHTRKLPIVTHLIPANPKVNPTQNVDDEDQGGSSSAPSTDAAATAEPPAQ